MTTYNPHITLPAFVFNQPALSILLPLAGGVAIGAAIRRESPMKPTVQTRWEELYLRTSIKDLTPSPRHHLPVYGKHEADFRLTMNRQRIQLRKRTR